MNRGFVTIPFNTTLKLPLGNVPKHLRFVTIPFNTTLKLCLLTACYTSSFVTIPFNTTLKQKVVNGSLKASFVTIPFNTTLKPIKLITFHQFRFVTIPFNTTLKPQIRQSEFATPNEGLQNGRLYFPYYSIFSQETKSISRWICFIFFKFSKGRFSRNKTCC